MKKLSIFACAALVALASCGNKATEAAGTENADSAVVEVPAIADSLTSVITEEVKAGAKDLEKVQVLLATLQTTYADLVKEGKLEEAKAYASAVQNYINENAEAIQEITANNTTVSSLIEGIKSLPVSAETTAEEALSAVSSNATSIVENAKSTVANTAVEAANQAAESAKAAAQSAVDETKAAAQAKVDEAKANAKAKVESKANEVKTKANDAVNNAVNNAANKLLGK